VNVIADIFSDTIFSASSIFEGVDGAQFFSHALRVSSARIETQNKSLGEFARRFSSLQAVCLSVNS
jgi:hypothetical protein